MQVVSGHRPPEASAAGPQIVGLAAALATALVPIRAHVVGFVPRSFLAKRAYVELAAATAYDALFVTALAAVAVLALLLPSRRWRRAVVSAFAAAAVVVAVSAIANVRAIGTIGRPFSFQWLYYSDYLMSDDARSAVLGSIDARLAAVAAAGVLLMLGGGVVAGRLIARAWAASPGRLRRVAAAAGALLLAGWFVGGHVYVTRHHWPADKIVPPLYALGHSALRASDLPLLFTAPTSAGDGDIRAAALPVPPPEGIVPVRHVVLYVLESVAARYVGAYGAPYGATPRIDGWARRAALLANAYAHAPATNRSLLSMLASAYPSMSYRGDTREYRSLPLATLAGELKSAGWATGFFHSSDLVYQRAGDFLRAHHFDHVEDYRDRPGEPLTSEEFPFLNGSDEFATVRSLLEWTAARGAQRWLAMAWTMGTHYPYFVRGTVESFPGVDDPLFARYLTALKVGDAAFGALMSELQRRGQLDDTLVVVLSDHGEAFGQHGSLGHASHIYEENVHIPLLLIGPGVEARRHASVAGLVDLAPTVMHLAGLTSPAGWQGRSLFAAGRPPRTYYFSPYSDFLVGCREGNLSYIFNGTRGSEEVYDLATDPEQRRNMAGTAAADVGHLRDRLAAWVQYQKRMYDGLVAVPAAGR